MKRGGGPAWAVIGFAAGLALAVAADAPPAAGPGPAELLRTGRSVEALKAAEDLLKACPGDVQLQIYRAKALLDLHRWADALAVAGPLGERRTDRPVLRLMAGDCELELGRCDAALRTWAPLLANPDLWWAEDAAERSARALAATGRREEARKLLDGALRDSPEPSARLMGLRLELTRRPEEAGALLEGIRKASPSQFSRMSCQRGLWAAVSGELLDEQGRASPPIRIRLRREPVIRPASSPWPMYVSPGPDSSRADRNELVMEVSINGGAPRKMVLDTGSSTFVVSAGLAAEAGLSPVCSSTSHGLLPEQRVAAGLVLVRRVEMGGLVLANVPAMVIDLPGPASKSVDGLIPAGVFERHALRYDPTARELDLFPTGTPPERALGERAARLNSMWSEGKPLVRAVVNGREGFFLFDTGAQTSVFDKGFAASLAGDGPSPAPNEEAEQLTGAVYPTVGGGAVIGLGPFTVRAQKCYILPLHQSSVVRCDGILGRDVLGGFAMFLDYGTNTLCLAPGAR